MTTTTTIQNVQPYLMFEGRCEEALDFYKTALGAETGMILRQKDSPVPPAEGCVPPGSGEKIMHAEFRVGEQVLMASDGRCSGNPTFEGVALSLTVETPDDADSLYTGLLDGGKALMPLEKTFFSEKFGMVIDRFGVTWMVLTRPN